MKNLEMLALAARGLAPLKEEIVFVGGATIELYLAGQPALMVRATDDVDCVVKVAARTAYHELEERLRAFRSGQSPRRPGDLDFFDAVPDRFQALGVQGSGPR